MKVEGCWNLQSHLQRVLVELRVKQEAEVLKLLAGIQRPRKMQWRKKRVLLWVCLSLVQLVAPVVPQKLQRPMFLQPCNNSLIQ